ncbi:bifunctional DNA primase/polymerase [Streptomyces sp. NPDC127066]|uniref:bifunctional DNA primase/polymerase n=1 Tax=Streptomyces sp. NPDC127066 TaxID=3347125 RepID=UPI0036554238
MSSTRNLPSSSPHSPGARSPEGLDVSGVTAEGAAWLASAGTYPRSTLALWRERPDAPVVLLCGSAFDVVSASALFGRRMLDRLWDEGPGSGPVAAHRGRILLFAAPGTAQRLPSLMEWEEWGVGTPPEPVGALERGGHPPAGAVAGSAGAAGSPGPGHGVRAGRCREVPPLLCHGTGDAVTVPPLTPGCGGPEAVRTDSRWLVAPDTRRPWLPGPEILLWAAVRAARAAAASAVRISIFPRADQDAKVYDVSRRR